ncbi:hypothetical protein BT69DRAFT_1321661 [Atractiella rhizophila]|nr:hypothetical protein BT69DRAFT_1321661 [Atractiella rhizophila]
MSSSSTSIPTLLPLTLPPPPSFPLPTLSLRSPQSADFIPLSTLGWTLSTHAFPAAYPRTRDRCARKLRGKGVESPPIAPWKKDEESKASLQDVVPIIDGTRERTAEMLRRVKVEDLEEEGLWMCANRYWKKDLDEEARRGGVTIVFGHANGMHKETWEPAIASLLRTIQTRNPDLIISEIWSLDHVQQGDAALLNEGRLGDVHDWLDSGRDFIQFMLRYLPSIEKRPKHSDSFLLPCEDDRSIIDLHSDPVPSTALPFRGRTIVGVGHSLGGCATALASSVHPSIYSQIILVDPVLTPNPTPIPFNRDPHVLGMTESALRRKDFWSSPTDARAYFAAKPFFAAWDTRILDFYIRYGLVETSEKEKKDGLKGREGLRLKTRREQEAFVFADRFKRSEGAYNRFQTVPSSLPVHIHFADVGRSHLKEELVEMMKKVTPNATWTRARSGIGHLAVQEDPEGTGETIADVIMRMSRRRSLRGKL